MTPAWTPDIVTTDLSRAVHYTLLWGLEGVALRTVGGAGDRVPFVNEAALRRRLEEAELPVVAVDPGVLEGDVAARAAWLNDLDVLAETAAFCRRVGCAVVRVGALAAGGYDRDAAAGALNRAADVAGRHGLRLAVRNEAGTAVATGTALSDLLRDAPDALAADWRPADALAAGEDPALGLRALLDADVPVAVVGVRDGHGGPGGWEAAVPGEGGVGWDGHLADIAAGGFGGPLVIDGLPAPAQTHGLAASTALISSARRARRR